MNRKQRNLVISIMLLFATTACQAGGDLVVTPAVGPVQLTTGIPSVIPPTPTIHAGSDMRTLFPSFSLTEPDAVCISHYYYALSCADSNGWHVYKNEYDEVSHPTSTIPNMIFGCPDGRIYLQEDMIYRVEGEALIEIGGYIEGGSLVCGSGDGIWVTDYSEVRHFDGLTWTSYPMEEYLGKSDVRNWDINSMAVAPNGDVWVTTDGLIATFDGSEWKTLTLPGIYSFPKKGDKGLAIDSNGMVWVIASLESCCLQLLRFDGSDWSIFPEPDDDNHSMHAIAADPGGGIWASTGGNKIFTLNPETQAWDFRFDVRQLGLGLRVNSITNMQFDGQGRLWVITNYGLGVYDGTQWTTYHVHNASLYMEEMTRLIIVGDGPQLPAWELKSPGSISGKLVSKTQTPFTDALVEVCIEVDLDISGETLCAHQAYHAVGSVDPDGSFIVTNVPVGTYYVYFRISGKWYELLSEELVPYISSSPNASPLTHPSLKWIVKEGEETRLGEIGIP